MFDTRDRRCPFPFLIYFQYFLFSFKFLAAKRAIDQGTRLAAVIEDARTGEVFEAPVAQNYKIMKFITGIIGSK